MPQSTRERLNALHFTPKSRERSHLHCWPKDSQLHHPPLQQLVTVTSTYKHLQLLQPYAESGLQNKTKQPYFPGLFQNKCHKLKLRSQAPAWEKQGSKRRQEVHKHVGALEMPRGSLSKQLLPPKNCSYQPEK